MARLNGGGVGGGSSSPLTTKGDVWSFSTTDDRFPVGQTDGQVLSVDSAEAFGMKWIDAVTILGTQGQVCYFASDSSVVGLEDGNPGQVLSTDGAGTLSWIDPPTTGWSLTGNAGTTFPTNFIGTTDDMDLALVRNNVLVGHIGNDGLGIALHYLFFYNYLQDAQIMVDSQYDGDADGNPLIVKGGDGGTGGSGNHVGGGLSLQGGNSVGTDMTGAGVSVHSGQSTGSAGGDGFRIYMPLIHGLPSGTAPVPEEMFAWFSSDHGLTFYGGEGGTYIMEGSQNADGTGTRLAIAGGSANGDNLAGGRLDLESGVGTGTGAEGEIFINLDNGGDGTPGSTPHGRETIGVFNGPSALLRIQRQSDSFQPKYILARSRANDADLQADDRIGGLRWAGKVGGDYYEFGRIQTYYDGTGGVMEFYSSTDAIGNIEQAFTINGQWKTAEFNYAIVEHGQWIINRFHDDTGSPIYYTERARAAGADVQAGDELGGIVFDGMISGTQQQFAGVFGQYAGSGGWLSLRAASDDSSTMVEGMVLDGGNQIINVNWFTMFDGLLNIKSNPTADAHSGLEMNIPNNSLTFSRGDVVYVDSSGNAALADATDNTTNPAIGLVAWDVTGTDPNVPVIFHGVMDLTTLAPAWTPGGIVYLAVGGGMTQAAPAATGNMIQILGVALTASKLYCKPELVMVEAL